MSPVIEGKAGGISSASWEGLAKGISEMEVSLAPGLERSVEQRSWKCVFQTGGGLEGRRKVCRCDSKNSRASELYVGV